MKVISYLLSMSIPRVESANFSVLSNDAYLLCVRYDPSCRFLNFVIDEVRRRKRGEGTKLVLRTDFGANAELNLVNTLWGSYRRH